MAHRSLAAVFTALLVGGCADAATSERTVIDIDPVAAAAAAVGIVAEGCTLASDVGSGVAVGASGQVVTVAHTVSGAERITVVAADGTEHDAVVDAFDADADLALLSVPSLGIAPLAIADGPVELDAATVYGWSPDGGVRAIPVEVTKRLVITIEDIYVEDEVTRTGMELSGDISVGVSGAAVIDADGSVSGIVYARSRGRGSVGFATDADELRSLLSDLPQGTSERCR